MKQRRFLGLDVVRGIAAFSVFSSHLLAYLPAGDAPLTVVAIIAGCLNFVFRAPGDVHYGVVIFIVLSGLCIHLPAAKDPRILQMPGYWRTFALRRAWRILPLYWFACLLGFVAVAIAYRVPGLNFGPLQGQAEPFAILPAMTKLLALTPTYAVAGTALGNGPLRTVATELWLYAAYPLVLLTSRRLGWLRATVLFLALYALSVVVGALHLANASLIGDSESVPRFLFYWVLGAGTAECAVRYDKPKHARYAATAVAIALPMLVAFNHLLTFRGAHAVRGPWLAGTSALLIYVALSTERRFDTGKSAVWRAMSRIGEESYALYAIHLPIILVTFVLADQSFGRLAAVLTTIAATWAVHVMVEVPSHQVAQRLGKAADQERVVSSSARP